MVDKYLDDLKGIAYFDWIKLKIEIDRMFDCQKGEFERELKLANEDKVKNHSVTI